MSQADHFRHHSMFLLVKKRKENGLQGKIVFIRGPQDPE